jgi:hypothetical protein
MKGDPLASLLYSLALTWIVRLCLSAMTLAECSWILATPRSNRPKLRLEDVSRMMYHRGDKQRFRTDCTLHVGFDPIDF